MEGTSTIYILLFPVADVAVEGDWTVRPPTQQHGRLGQVAEVGIADLKKIFFLFHKLTFKKKSLPLSSSVPSSCWSPSSLPSSPQVWSPPRGNTSAGVRERKRPWV